MQLNLLDCFTHLNCSLVFQPSYSEFQISVSPTCTIPLSLPSGAVSVVSLVYRTPADEGSSREAQSSIYPPFEKMRCVLRHSQCIATLFYLQFFPS